MSLKPKTCAFVFARGGSKGVPGKNIREFAGKPLLAYSLETAHRLSEISVTFVSTDDAQIADVARTWGATVIKRPTELAQDESPEWLAWQHAVDWVQERHGVFEQFVSLPATAPLRKDADVQNCLMALDDQVDMVVTMTETNRSPWYNMVRTRPDGTLNLLIQDANNFVRRQDVPKAFDMATVAYVTRPTFIMNNERIWDGRIKGVEIPIELALDIDTLLDFKLAEFLMAERQSEKGQTC